MLGGIFTKVNLICNIVDKSTNECNTFKTKAIYQKDRIKYIYENDKYVLNIISSKELILKRNTQEIESIINFEESKITTSIYYMKQQNISLEIKILTKKIIISDKKIKILYTVIDSNIDYEFNIEMSDE